MRVSWFPLFVSVGLATSMLENLDTRTASNPNMHVAASESKEWSGSHMRIIPKELRRRSKDIPMNQSMEHQEEMETDATSTEQGQDSQPNCIGRACTYIGRACMVGANATWNCVKAVDNEKLVAAADACTLGTMGCILALTPMMAKEVMQGLPASELSQNLIFCGSVLFNTGVLTRALAQNDTAPESQQVAANFEMLLDVSRAHFAVSAGCLLCGIAAAVNDKIQDLPISNHAMHLVNGGQVLAVIGSATRMLYHLANSEATGDSTQTVGSAAKLEKRAYPADSEAICNSANELKKRDNATVRTAYRLFSANEMQSSDQRQDNQLNSGSQQCLCIYQVAGFTAAFCGLGTLAGGVTMILIELAEDLPVSNPSKCLVLLGTLQLVMAPLVGIFAEDYTGRHCRQFAGPPRRQNSQPPVTAPIETEDVCHCESLEPAVLEEIRNRIVGSAAKLEKRADPAELEATRSSTQTNDERHYAVAVVIVYLGMSCIGAGCGIMLYDVEQDIPLSNVGIALVALGAPLVILTPFVAFLIEDCKKWRSQRSSGEDSNIMPVRVPIELEDTRPCEPLEPAPAYTKTWDVEAQPVEIWQDRRYRWI